MEERMTPDELKRLKELSHQFAKAKMNLGGLEMQKHYIINDILKIEEESFKFEQEIAEKYGKDAVIDFNTGIITHTTVSAMKKV